jgi:ABC-type uncharacterized transport system substrate-binding protein
LFATRLPLASCIRLLAGALLAWTVSIMAAQAHPHVFITGKTEIIYNVDGKVAALRHSWSFDEGYSAFMTQGLDKNGDGKLTPDELEELAKVNIESLPDVGFFTVLKANGKAQDFATPTDYGLSFDKGVLTLAFTLPLKAAAIANRALGLEIGDPSYFVAFSLIEGDNAITLKDAPKGCAITVSRPKALDAAMQQKLSQENFAALGNDLSAFQSTSKALVACP